MTIRPNLYKVTIRHGGVEHHYYVAASTCAVAQHIVTAYVEYYSLMRGIEVMLIKKIGDVIVEEG